MKYKLLTPGPLTTTETVKEQMLFDHCTWDDDYKKITLEIRDKLLGLAHVSEPEYTVVLMQGSGTFGSLCPTRGQGCRRGNGRIFFSDSTGAGETGRTEATSVWA